MPHNPLGPICTAATIHLAAAISNFAWLEVSPYDTDLLGQRAFFINLPLMKNAVFAISDAPGLGRSRGVSSPMS
ncbi:Enolase C-terminal domain-like [Spirosoma endophyticum]|uniref:Enolase C-terminal domain-like n=1 Tax=Spirosoma endophyticum TaxID=662367 RepID=A0A1I1TWI1_9BACT|nr:Enolase C-terminal domain-like [Spirosoma endophyticum]